MCSLPDAIKQNKVLNGQKLHDRVVADLRKFRAPDARIHKSHWAEVAREYARGSSAVDDLEALDGACSEEFQKAWSYLHHNNPAQKNIMKFLSFMDECNPLKECEYQALAMTSLNSRIIQQENWDVIVISIMSMFRRHGVKDAYAALYEACFAVFDPFLSEHYNDLAKNGVQWYTYCRENHQLLSDALDWEDVTIALAHKDTLHLAKQALVRLYASGCTGRVIFGPLLDDLVEISFSELVDAEIAKILVPNSKWAKEEQIALKVQIVQTIFTQMKSKTQS